MGAFTDLKLTELELAQKGMTSLSGTRWANQAELLKTKLDEDGTFVAQRLGQVLDLLESMDAAASIGTKPFKHYTANKLQAVLEEIEAYLQQQVEDILDGVVPVGSITTDRLQDGAVVEGKIAQGAVTGEKLAPAYQDSVLSPATRTLHDLPTNATPDDLLKRLKVSKIGDIIETMRSDLSDDWLLCNGMPYNQETYPDLLSVMGKRTAEDNWVFDAAGTSMTTAEKVAAGNGYWVVSHYVSANSYVYYSTSLSGPWTLKLVSTAGYFTSLKFVNGYFTATVNDVIYYTADPSGTWSAVTVSSGSALADVAYGNGNWVAVTQNARIFYTSTIVGTWTQGNGGVQLQNVSAGVRKIHFGNGYFVVINIYGTMNYSTSPTVTFAYGAPGVFTYCSDVHYDNGYWVVCGSNAVYYAPLVPSAGWTAIKTGNGFSIAGQTWTSVMYGNGYWVVVGSGRILCSKTVDGYWNTPGYAVNLTSVAYLANQGWLTVGYKTLLKLTELATPLLSGESNKYIKGK